MSGADLRERLLTDFAVLKVPLTSAQLDAMLARAERGGLSHLEFVQALIAEQAQQRRERAIARRIKDACFRDSCTLADFDWDFNARAINRTQIEELATGAFIGRRDNLVMVGQSGVGKSRMIQSVGQAAVRFHLELSHFFHGHRPLHRLWIATKGGAKRVGESSGMLAMCQSIQ